jgi:hypothetical protein
LDAVFPVVATVLALLLAIAFFSRRPRRHALPSNNAKAPDHAALEDDLAEPVDDPNHSLDRARLGGSNFHREYEQLPCPHIDELLCAVRQVAYGHAKNVLRPEQVAQVFIDKLHAEWGVLGGSVPLSAQKLWTSFQCFDPKALEDDEGNQVLDAEGQPLTAGGREFCSIWGEVLRRDQASLARPSAVIARALNQNLVVTPRPGTGRAGAHGHAAFPPQPWTWRGGGFGVGSSAGGAVSPAALRVFFEEARRSGQPYRTKQCLATSFKEDVADGFIQIAHEADGGAELVKWKVRLDPRGEHDGKFRCKHVNLITQGHVDSEKEYLFAAFSVFTVREVQWSDTPTEQATPHLIELEAALDNKEFPVSLEEDLLLAPWC